CVPGESCSQSCFPSLSVLCSGEDLCCAMIVCAHSFLCVISSQAAVQTPLLADEPKVALNWLICNGIRCGREPWPVWTRESEHRKFKRPLERHAGQVAPPAAR